MCVSQHGRVRACVGSVVSCPTLHSSPLQMIQRWIQVAEECLRIRNYNAVFAIALGLSAHYVAYVPLLCGATHSACGVTHAPILLVLERIDAVPGFSRRLATAWGLLSRSVLDRFKALTTFTASASNFKEYRKVGWLAGWVVSWLAGWLAGWLVAWVGGWVVLSSLSWAISAWVAWVMTGPVQGSCKFPNAAGCVCQPQGCRCCFQRYSEALGRGR